MEGEARAMRIELGDLAPLVDLATKLAQWEAQIRLRPLAENDPVVHTLADVRKQLQEALDNARDVEIELTSEQYAALLGISREALYKRWQRGQLPEARMRGGKLVVPLPVKAVASAAA
jgi:predicted DNA-binding transcriptional regulator AlpA